MASTTTQPQGLLQQIAGLRRNPIVDLLITLVAAVAIAYGVQRWIVKPYRIPSSSMERTLHIGDRVLAVRFLYHFENPHRGDIIVFHPNGTGNTAQAGNHVASVTYIKRLIGLPGDWVQASNGHVQICTGPAGAGLQDPERAVRLLDPAELRPDPRAGRALLHDGRQPRVLRRLARLGLDQEEPDHRTRLHDLLAARPDPLLLRGFRAAARRRRAPGSRGPWRRAPAPRALAGRSSRQRGCGSQFTRSAPSSRAKSKPLPNATWLAAFSSSRVVP